MKLKTNIKKLRRNLRTFIESFEKSLEDQKMANLEKSVKLKSINKKTKTMFEKSQQNFEKLLLKCTEGHKIEIRKCLNFTEDRKTFY